MRTLVRVLHTHCPKRTADAHARNFRHFLGLRGSELTTRTFIKMDEAGELEQAAHAVGMVPEDLVAEQMAPQCHPRKRRSRGKGMLSHYSPPIWSSL